MSCGLERPSSGKTEGVSGDESCHDGNVEITEVWFARKQTNEMVDLGYKLGPHQGKLTSQTPSCGPIRTQGIDSATNHVYHGRVHTKYQFFSFLYDHLRCLISLRALPMIQLVLRVLHTSKAMGELVANYRETIEVLWGQRTAGNNQELQAVIVIVLPQCDMRTRPAAILRHDFRPQGPDW